MSKALEYLLSRPLLCTPEAAEVAATIVSREPQAEMRSIAEIPRPDESRKLAGKAAGVSVISVRGGISRYTTMMQDLGCGGTSCDMIAGDLREALNDPLCRSILLDFDSPGGEANGIGEVAGLIRAANAKKPVTAYVGGEACSAAYWLAAAAGTVVCSEMAYVGSVGAVIGIRIDSDKPGTKSYRFISSQSPLKQADPATDAGKESWQERCDNLAGLFIDNVAKLRGTTPDVVMSDFGKGAVMLGHAAHKVGMVDGVSDFETVLGRLSRGECAVDKPAPSPKPSPKPTPGKPVGKAMTKGTFSMANPLARLLAFLKADPEAAAVLADVETDATADASAAVTGLLSGQAPAAVALATEEKIRAQVTAEVESKNVKALEATFTAQASAWFDGLVTAGKALPRDKGASLAHYVEASVLDFTRGPLAYTNAAGQPATALRVDTVKAAVPAPTGDKTKDAVADSALAAAALAGITPLDTTPPDPETARSDARVASLQAEMDKK